MHKICPTNANRNPTNQNSIWTELRDTSNKSKKMSDDLCLYQTRNLVNYRRIILSRFNKSHLCRQYLTSDGVVGVCGRNSPFPKFQCCRTGVCFPIFRPATSKCNSDIVIRGRGEGRTRPSEVKYWRGLLEKLCGSFAFLRSFYGNFIKIIGLKAPGNCSDPFWSNNFPILLLERPKPPNSMVSGFFSPWDPLIYGFEYTNILLEI